MPKFEDNIFGLLPKDEWLGVGFNVTRPNDPIDGLFPDEKTDNIMAKWQTIASEYQLPAMAHYHGFDTEANKTFRVPVDTHNIEKGLIKVKINQSERLRTLLRAGVQQNALYDYVIRDGVRLADQVVTRTKVAKNELLATGKITIKENNLDLNVDYGVPSDNVDFEFPINDDTDVPAAIQKIVDKASDLGVTLTGIVTSKQVVTKLRTNKSIQIAINGANSVGTLIRRSELEAFLSDEFGINQIITNDLKYISNATLGENGRPVLTQARYFPQDKITFFGTANTMNRLGEGLWGDPPEVIDVPGLQTSSSEVSPFVYITQWHTDDPAETWTKASGLFMPVLFDPNSLFIAKVTDGTTTPAAAKKANTTKS